MKEVNINELIQKVRNDYNEVKNINKSILIEHPEICMEAVKSDGMALEYVPEELKIEEMYKEAIKSNGFALKYVPEKLRTEEICMKAVKSNGGALKYVPEKLRTEEICLEAIKSYEVAIEYIPEEVMIAHPEICMKAVKFNGYALKYVPEKLRTEEICLEAMKTSGDAVKYTPEEVQIAHPEIFLEIVKNNPYSLEYISNKLKINHPEICLEAAKVNAWDGIQYTPEEVQIAHPEICFEAVKRDYNLLKYVSTKVQIDHPQICLEVIKENPYYLEYIPEEVQIAHPEICLEALKVSKRVREYIPREVKMAHPEIYVEIVKNDPMYLQLIPKEVQVACPEICLEAVKINAKSIIHIPKDLRTEEICSEAVIHSHGRALKFVPEEVLVNNKEIIRKSLEYDVNNLRFLSEKVILRESEIIEEYNEKLQELFANYNNQYAHNTHLAYQMLINKDILEELRLAGFNPTTFDIFNKFVKDKELLNNIKDIASILQKSKWNNSLDYREEVEQQLIINMFNVLGKDEALRLMSIPELSEEEIKRISDNSNELYNKLFEEKYQLKGDVGYISGLFNGLNLGNLNSKGKNVKLDIYRKINQALEDGKEVNIIEIVEEKAEELEIDIPEKVRANIANAISNLNKNITKEKLEALTPVLDKKIDEFVTNDRDTINRLIKNTFEIYSNLNNNSFDIDDFKKLLIEKLNEKDENSTYRYSPHMRNQESHLIKAVEQTFEEKVASNIVKKNLTSVLMKVKSEIGKGWMSKLDGLPKELSKEEYEKLKEKLGTELTVEVRSQMKMDELKEISNPVEREKRRKEIEEETYRVLSQNEVAGLLTYEKAEKMFDGIHANSSEEFRRFYRINKEEIMSKPEYYTNFSRIVNEFESVIEDPHIKNRYENGELGVKEVLEILDSRLYDSIDNGTYELATLSKKSGLDEKKFEFAKKVFEETKNREYQTIPHAKVTEKKYRGRILRADDPLHLVVGNITTCCQKIGGVGEGAMLHSAIENNGGIFVVEKLDGEGNVARVVGQSWVWRNRDRLCFDNIEISDVAHELMSNEDEKEILDVYMKAGSKIIENDKKMLGKMLNEGKISQDVYDRLVIKEVTAGIGYNDLSAMTEMEREGKLHTTTIVSPVENEKEYANSENGTVRPWVDSGKKQIVLAEMDEKERKTIQKRIEKSKEKKEYTLEDVPSWYGKGREVEDLKEKDITPDIISEIKKIESAVYRETQQTLQDCYDVRDLKDIYNMSDNMQVSMSKDSDWYMIYEEKDKEMYIADVALVGGINSEKNQELSFDKKAATLELFERIYSLLEDMGKKGKNVRFEATRDTSYLNVERMLKKGLIEVIKNEEDKFYSDDSIDMNNMVIKPNAEKIEKELESVRNLLQKVYENRMLKGVSTKKKTGEDKEI